jgi:glycosyltransferase involved in cell wall biosynthesis
VSGVPPVRRVVQVHTRYRQPGGEDRVVEAERQLLEDVGVAVEQVIFDNADLHESRTLAGDLRLAASAIWSRNARRRVATALKRHRAEVMHVHNTFAAASPSVYGAASTAGVPVVQTLHNYRFVCPSATTFRDGHACTDCVGRRIAWPGVVHSCVRGSRAQSLVATATLGVHRALRTYETGIDTYVALTSFQRQLLMDGGLPGERIQVVPNFLEPDPGPGTGPRSGILYVGRLSEEKGTATLVRAADLVPGVSSVVGDGPLAPPVQEAAAAGRLDYLGPLSAAAVGERLRGAAALVVPSICFEGFPMVLVEAYAAGTPIIASRIGSLAEIVEDGATGVLVEPGDGARLAQAMSWALDHPGELARMGAAGRERYETRYRGAAHLATLLDIYAASIKAKERAISA